VRIIIAIFDDPWGRYLHVSGDGHDDNDRDGKSADDVGASGVLLLITGTPERRKEKKTRLVFALNYKSESV